MMFRGQGTRERRLRIGGPVARRWRQGALAVLWLGLSLNAGLEDPTCPHHGGVDPMAAAAPATAHADHHAPADPADHHGDDPCACLGLCVPGVLTAAAPEPLHAPEPTFLALEARPTLDGAAPLLAPVAYLLPFATAPPLPLPG